MKTEAQFRPSRIACCYWSGSSQSRFSLIGRVVVVVVVVVVALCIPPSGKVSSLTVMAAK